MLPACAMIARTASASSAPLRRARSRGSARSNRAAFQAVRVIVAVGIGVGVGVGVGVAAHINDGVGVAARIDDGISVAVRFIDDGDGVGVAVLSHLREPLALSECAPRGAQSRLAGKDPHRADRASSTLRANRKRS
jgi:hypothetical protein